MDYVLVCDFTLLGDRYMAWLDVPLVCDFSYRQGGFVCACQVPIRLLARLAANACMYWI